jgi:hypothetical protein
MKKNMRSGRGKRWDFQDAPRTYEINECGECKKSYGGGSVGTFKTLQELMRLAGAEDAKNM